MHEPYKIRLPQPRVKRRGSGRYKYNGIKKEDKRKNNDLQKIIQKTNNL